MSDTEQKQPARVATDSEERRIFGDNFDGLEASPLGAAFTAAARDLMTLGAFLARPAAQRHICDTALAWGSVRDLVRTLQDIVADASLADLARVSAEVHEGLSAPLQHPTLQAGFFAVGLPDSADDATLAGWDEDDIGEDLAELQSIADSAYNVGRAEAERMRATW